jgi:DNA-binding LacI/PurR family transcriptional regulator
MVMDSTSGTGRADARSSIGDVARLVGVSKQTVSNVLNGRPGYTPATKERVLAAMAQLSYQPRQAARTLRSQRSMQLGFHMIEPQLDAKTEITFSMVQEVIRAAEARGYHLLVFTGEEDGGRRAFDAIIDAGSVDGFLLSNLRADDPRPHHLAARGVPFAAFGRLPASLPQRFVDVDNDAAIQAVIDHFVADGHRDIAYVGLDDGEYWTLERERGFRAAMESHGLRLQRSVICAGGREEARAFTRRVLRRKRPPTAIVCGSDALANDVVNTARTLGFQPGRQVMVTGFGGGPLSRITEPVLTTVEIPVAAAAKQVVELCLAAGEGRAVDGPVILPTRIRRGGTA